MAKSIARLSDGDVIGPIIRGDSTYVANPRGRLHDKLKNGVTNQWARLIIYCFACLFTSCIYFGWQDYSKMLIKGGAYDWLCDGTEVMEDPSSVALCEAQQKKISSIYSYANGSEFACAALAGILLDHLGPRLTALVGELSHAGSIIMLCLSGKSVQLYIPGLILAGVSVNVVAFPSLTVMEHWPNRQALFVSIIVGCQSAASVVAPILHWMWKRNPEWTYRGIWFTWLAAVWLPISCLYLWALPRSRNYDQLVKGWEGAKIVDEEGELKETDIKAAKDGGDWKTFIKECLTVDMFLMALFCGLLMFQFAYYPAVLEGAVSVGVSDFVGWITPLQGPFSMVIGFCMDYTGTFVIMLIMCATLFFVNMSCGWAANNEALMKVVGLWFVFIQSATYNVKYTFVGEMYDPYNFGKLVGFLGICSGVGVYLSGPVTQASDYSRTFLLLTIGVAGMVIVTFFVGYRQIIQGKSHKTEHDAGAKHRIACLKPRVNDD